MSDTQLALGQLEPDDPNADLIGVRFQSDQGELVVVGTAPWSDAYMLCDAAGVRTARAVSLLRTGLAHVV